MAKPVYKIDTSELDNAADFDFQILSGPDDLEASLEVIRKSFFVRELIHCAIKAADNPAALQELEQLLRITAEDNVTVVAREKSSGKIVSVAFNKLQEKPQPGKPGAFDEIAAKFKQPESLAIMNLMIVIDSKVDMYEKFNTDSLFELMFLGTLPEYCGRRLAKDVSKVTLQIARQTPAAAVTILCSSPWSERISAALGFLLLHTDSWAEFTTAQGVKYSDIVGADKRYTLRAYPLRGDTKL